jgi:Family of unknown function (DUF6114)
MSAESLEARTRISRWRVSFRHWRWQCPFWAGLLTLLAGIPIVYIPYADPSLGDLSFRLATTTGAGSLIIGVLLGVLGLTLWFQPPVRVFSGVAAILLGLISLVVSNFGGFFVGFLLALVGGGMGVSWMPGEPSANDTASGGDTAVGGPVARGPEVHVSAVGGRAGTVPDAGPEDGGHRAG